MPSVEQLNLNRTRFHKVLRNTHGPETTGTYWVVLQLPLTGPRAPIRMYFSNAPTPFAGWYDITENGDLGKELSTRAIDMWIEQLPEPPRKASSHGGNHIA